MNTSKLRSKRIVIPTIAAVAVMGVGGVVWSSASADDALSGTELDRASSAALDAVGNGKVTDSEADDDGGAYEVEVTKDDGSQVDVRLDKSFTVISEDADADDDADDADDANDAADDANDEADDANDAADEVNDNDSDDRVLTAAERTSAEKAAITAVGGGTATDTDASDDPGEAYEVDVLQGTTEWTVELDASFGVLDKRVDN